MKDLDLLGIGWIAEEQSILPRSVPVNPGVSPFRRFLVDFPVVVAWPFHVLHLVMNPGLPEEQSIPLREGGMTIGRTKDNDVFCVHKSLSRRHARVEWDKSGKVRVIDLMSKNGLFFNGKRVQKCDVVEGDSFRCGDVSFLVEGMTARSPKLSSPAITLPSPFGEVPTASKRPTKIPAPVLIDDDQRYKDKLFVLIRASELLVTETSLDKLFDELVILAVQVLEVERIALITFDEAAEMELRAVKTFMGPAPKPYSRRVVDWVVDKGSAALFGNVSTDESLGKRTEEDAVVKAAMCVPINPGGGMIGVLYADSVSRADCYRPDDLALLRALANLAAAAIECDAMRRSENTEAR